REALSGLAALVDEAPSLRLAVVVATDTDDARTRQHLPSVVTAARRGRRGALLGPDFADGALMGVTVPMHTVEPMAGVGGGLLCLDASARVVQFVGVPVAKGDRS